MGLTAQRGPTSRFASWQGDKSREGLQVKARRTARRVRPFSKFVVLSGRLSNPTHELERLLKRRATLTSKKRKDRDERGRGLTDEISSGNRATPPRQLTRLKPLDKAEIVARTWRGQSSAELAAMFKVTPRTINRVTRDGRRS